MSVLDSINEQRQKDVIEQKKLVSLAELKTSEHYNSVCFSFETSIQQKSPVSIIAEHKRASPSEGMYGCPAALADVVRGYEKAGVAAMSILTEPHRFGGSLDHLREARNLTQIPLLRKDFIVDPYQVHEAKSAGADAILLIAAGLHVKQALDLGKLAHDLGMQVLLELHDASELDYLDINPDVIGINNRNLKTLTIDLQSSIDLLDQLPTESTKISESGIKDEDDAARMLLHGYDGLLVGTQFMKTNNPSEACRSFIDKVQNKLKLKPTRL